MGWLLSYVGCCVILAFISICLTSTIVCLTNSDRATRAGQYFKLTCDVFGADWTSKERKLALGLPWLPMAIAQIDYFLLYSGSWGIPIPAYVLLIFISTGGSYLLHRKVGSRYEVLDRDIMPHARTCYEKNSQIYEESQKLFEYLRTNHLCVYIDECKKILRDHILLLKRLNQANTRKVSLQDLLNEVQQLLESNADRSNEKVIDLESRRDKLLHKIQEITQFQMDARKSMREAADFFLDLRNKLQVSGIDGFSQDLSDISSRMRLVDQTITMLETDIS